MTDQLLSTDPDARDAVIGAAENSDLIPDGNLQYDFEHGQWWVTYKPSGAQWSVVDCQTGGGEDYFDFEQVSDGDGEE